MLTPMIIYIINGLIMELLFTPPFRKFLKKQLPPMQLAIQDEIDKVSSHPELGKGKKGDRDSIQVHTFKFQRQEYLIAYETGEGKLIFFMIGSHENFYRDLKKYEKEFQP
jgi:mRNA-degrading endonuclease RelE of RelBE toxin-antitoxin system